jgi:predicted ArsR family transcriptional regulator
MGQKPRTETGEWEPTASEQEVIEAIKKHSPAATSEVADEIGMTRQGADARLRRLHEAGVVEKKKIAAALVWFVDADNE